MPTKFRKVVVEPGTHHHRKGVAEVSPARIRRWLDSFRAMKADGIKIPIAWGHQPKAHPVEEDRIAEEEFYRSRFNAGFVDDFELGPRGELIVVADVPPGMELDGAGNIADPVNHTRIGEVSAAVRDWQDGKGRVWEDAVRHIALTTLPVNHGTPGFEAVLATADDGDLLLGTATLHTRLDLGTQPTRKGKDMPDLKKTPADDEPVDIMADEEGGDEPEEKPIIDFKDAAPAGNGQDLVKELIPLLAESGIHLTPDTDEQNFLQHLKVSLHAVKHREKPPEPEVDPEAGKKPVPQEPVQEEAPPLLMSTATAQTPQEKAQAAYIARQARDGVARRIDALEKATDPASGLPFVKPGRLAALREQAGGFELSLTPDGEPVETELDRTLALLEEMAPIQLSIANADEHVPPEKADAQAVDEIVGKISSPGPHKATA